MCINISYTNKQLNSGRSVCGNKTGSKIIMKLAFKVKSKQTNKET